MAACPSCGRENPADARFCSACGTRSDCARVGTRAAEGGHDPLLRPRRVDGARRIHRPGGATRAHAPLLRGSPRDRRAARRCRGEIRRRRGHGGLRDPGRARGRRAARRTRRRGDARFYRRARARGANRRRHRRGRRRRRRRDARHRRRGERRRPARAGGRRRRVADRGADACCSSATPSRSSRWSRSRSRASRSRSRPSACSRSIGDAAPLARHPETPLVGRERERNRLWRDYEDAVADRTCRLFTLLGPAGHRQVPARRRLPRASRRRGRRPPRPLSPLRGGDHVLAARRDARRSRRRPGDGRHLARRRRASPSAACSKPVPPSDPRSSSSTTFSGRSPSSSTSSSTSPTSRATRRSCCSASRAPSSSTSGPGGAAGSSTRPRSCSSRWGRGVRRADGAPRPGGDARRGATRANHRRVGGQPALRRGDACDGPREAAPARSRSRRRFRRCSRRASTRSGTTSGPCMGTRPSRARCSMAGRSPSCPGSVAPTSKHILRAHPQGADPPESPLLPGEELPLPAPPDPRRGLRSRAEGAAGASCTSGSPTGSSAEPRPSSWTRFSATTSSRRTGYRAELGHAGDAEQALAARAGPRLLAAGTRCARTRGSRGRCRPLAARNRALPTRRPQTARGVARPRRRPGSPRRARAGGGDPALGNR